MVKMADFDKFGSDYESILSRDVRFSGENALYFANYKAECIARYLGSDFKGRILEYGCGVGLLVKHLRKFFDQKQVEIIGYDISKESIKEASKNMKDVKFTHNLAEISNASFDAIILANVLHHIKIEERPLFLRKATGLLKKKGYIFVFEHNPYNPATRLVVRSSVLDKGVSLLRPDEVVRLLSGVGVTIFEKRYIVFFPRLFKALRFLEPNIGRVPLGAQYLCIGKL